MRIVADKTRDQLGVNRIWNICCIFVTLVTSQFFFYLTKGMFAKPKPGEDTWSPFFFLLKNNELHIFQINFLHNLLLFYIIL